MNATFLIPGDVGLMANGSHLARGDEIAVFTTEGVCAGVAVWNGEHLALSAWGDDVMTPNRKEGFVEGEPITFRVWDASSSLEYGGDHTALSAAFMARVPSRIRGVFSANAIYELGALTPLESVAEPFLEANTVAPPQGTNSRWHRIKLSGTYTNPVVVMGPADHVGEHDTFVRVGNVTESGFEFIIEGGGHLGGRQIPRPISYVVAEQGWYRLGDGVLVEAGFATTSNAKVAVRLRADFSSPPIILSQVISDYEDGMVTSRQSNITSDGFELHLQGERSRPNIQPETVAYIAIEAGIRSRGGRKYDVGRASGLATGTFHAVAFSAGFDAPPAVVAAMQSVRRESTSSIRLRNRTSESFDVLIDEHGLRRTGEPGAAWDVVGYAAFAPGRLNGTSPKKGSRRESHVQNVVSEAAEMPPPSGPAETSLDGIYPNPFNPSASIRFGLAADEHVRLDVFDLTGRHVATLVDQVLDAGWHVSTFDGTGLASGIYLCRLETPTARTIAKMVLLK